MEAIVKLNGYLRKLEEFILSYSVIIMAVILVANVFARLLFNNSLRFAEELSSILTIAVSFVGVSYGARVGRHIIMTVMFDIMPKKGKKIFLFISSIVTCVALLYLAYLSGSYVFDTVMRTGRVTPALGIPMWIPYFMVPLGFIMGAVQYAIIFLMNVTDKENYHTCIDPLPDETADPDILLMDAQNPNLNA